MIDDGRGGRGGTAPGLPDAFFLTDAARTPEAARTIARLPGGVGVIFRNYESAERGRLGARLRTLCRRCHVPFFVAGDTALAEALGADGLHLPEWQLRGDAEAWRSWRSRGAARPLTAAVHSMEALRRALILGLDAVFLSSAFATASHPGATVLGPHRLARMAVRARQGGVAAYALGGIDIQTQRRLPPGLAGFGAIGIFEK